MAVHRSVDEMIGNTPLLRLSGIEKKEDLKSRLYAKLECFNPAGSAKDRIAFEMINEAEKSGSLVPGSTIIEPTSGNTGIGLSAIAACRGYRVIIVMPDSMSAERILLMKAYGAQVVLTEGRYGMQGAIDKAKELAEKIDNSFIPSQFTNPANPDAHFKTTGPEIWADTYGSVDIFVAGAGTGGTLTGVGKFLKSKKPSVRIVAVEPENSAVLSGGKPGAHGLQGIGAGFVPEVLDTGIIDEIVTVGDEEAYASGRLMGATEGVLVGISSGAALHAALLIAKRKENENKTIVVLLPDTGERYLSTPMFFN